MDLNKEFFYHFLHRKITIYTCIFILIILIVILSFFIIVNRQEEGFTELYFKGDLPKTIVQNGNNEFSFVIHNNEFMEKAYYYEAHIESKLLKKGYVTLDHNESTSIYCPITIREVPDREFYIVTVTVNEVQSIHFWTYLR
ncbi:hypothetical protein KAR91_88020 [Candidatus Pacearchaeota archaeon]|nr:hypothetical protein [Candidatus Pacearchaeota archaeon]